MKEAKNPLPKILHVHTLPVVSGSGINTFFTMERLKNKYSMEMACAPGGDLIGMVERAGIQVRPIKHFVAEVCPWKDIHALWQLYRLLRRQRYDLIHTHNSKGGFIGRLASRLAGGPPVVHTIHGFAFHENERPWRRRLFLILEKAASHWCSKFICISQPLVDLCVRHMIARPQKIRKIYSGIEVEKFAKTIARKQVRRELGLGEEDIAVGQVSKLWEGKGHHDIIEAAPQVFASNPRVKIFFIGDGYLRTALEALVQQKGLQGQLVFLGHRHNIHEITSALDIAVLASHFEGMGRVVLEAMAAGVPVVATRVGGIVELVQDGKMGMLVPPHRPDELARAIIRLAANPELRQAMGLEGRRRVGREFSVQTMVEQIAQVYQEVLGESGTARKD